MMKPAETPRRVAWLQLRLTEEEKAIIERAAMIAGLTMSEYVRVRCELPLDNVVTREYTVTTDRREE